MNKNYTYFMIFFSLFVLYFYSTRKNITENLFNIQKKNYINYPSEYKRYIKKKYGISYNDNEYNSKCIIQEYKPWTLTAELKFKLKNMILKFLNKYNYKHYLNDFLTNYNYNSVTIIIDRNNNKIYDIDLFLYDLVQFVNYRLKLKIIEFYNGDSQLISLQYLNSQNTDSSQLIVYNPHLDGIMGTKLEYSVLDTDKKNWIHNNEFISPSDIRNKLILNPNVCKLSAEGKNAWPCTPVGHQWDKFGVLINPEQTNSCNGINTSTKTTAITPVYNPTITGVPNIDKEYGWLFDLWRGIPSFPTGKSTRGR